MPSEQIYSELYELTDELLHAERSVRLKVGGYSMFPYFRPGDEVIIKKCSADSLRRGDVVVYKSRDIWIAHRLLRTKVIDNVRYFRLKGDSCIHTDPWISEKMVTGKIISCFRNKKTIDLLTRKKRIENLIIALLSFIIAPFIRLFIWTSMRNFKIIRDIKGLLKTLYFVYRISSKKLVVWNTVVAVIQGTLPFVVIYMLKILIDHIHTMNQYEDKTEAYRMLVTIIIATVVVYIAQAIVSIISGELRERISQAFSLNITSLLHKKYTSLDMAYLEDSNHQDMIHRAIQEAGVRPMKMHNEVMTLIQAAISWLAIIFILLTIHWAIFFVILVAVIPGFWVRIRFSKQIYRLNKENSQKQREGYYYNRILTAIQFAKEIRLFNLERFFSERYESIQKGLHKQRNKLMRKRAIADFFTQTFAITLTFSSFGFVAYLAVLGTLSIGTVVLFFMVFQRGFSVMMNLFQSMAGLIEDNVFMKDFFSFNKLPSLRKAEGGNYSLNSLQKGITVENISFKYPSSQRRALESVSLDIPKGKTVALVGANGSGKTTLVKLLAGFYIPDSGRILFDDTDTASVNPDELRKQIAAVFQDFALYNLTASENIYLGNCSFPPSAEAIRQAAKNAGIDDIIEKLPKGYDTMLGNLFEKGEELSIGQWQKLAISKAFYRDAPIVFMDEPSSALDAETELHLLQNLKILAKEKTVLVISHRFSTIKWVDTIYVMDKGCIVESGNHEELMEKRGKYYEMYEIYKEK